MIGIILLMLLLILFGKFNSMHSFIQWYINTCYCCEPHYVNREYECQNLHMINKPQK